MTVTPFGYVFFAILAVGVLLTWQVVGRMKKPGEAFGCLSTVFVGFGIVSILLMFVMFAGLFVQTVDRLVNFPRFEAEIVSFDSFWDDVTTTDSDGNTRTQKVLMHVPTLRFTDGTGEVVVMESNVSTGAKPVVGGKMTVGFRDGALIEVSLTTAILLSGLGLFVAVMGYLSIWIVFYGAGWKRDWLGRIGHLGFFWVLLPGAMAAMCAGMFYGAYGYFTGSTDLDWIGAALALFFGVVLVLTLIGYFVLLTRGKAAQE